MQAVLMQCQSLEPVELADARGDDASQLQVRQVYRTDPKVGEVACDSGPATWVRVSFSPAPEHVLGVIKPLLELKQSLTIRRQC